jgi:hypothetical protein
MIIPVLHPLTDKDIRSVTHDRPHAIALLGSQGMGKGYVAKYITSEMLGISIDRIEYEPYIMHVKPGKGIIGIEQSREILKFLKLKTTGENELRRLIIIEDADAVTFEAQNALLKIIEEPPSDTMLLLTISDRALVLPTILSRVQSVTVRTPMYDMLADHFICSGFSRELVSKIMTLSDGRPGLAYKLLHNSEQNEYANAINTAKSLLSMDYFRRIQKIDDIVATKQTIPVVEAFELIAHAALVSTSSKGADTTIMRKWANIGEQAGKASKQLRSNAQPKLVLTNFCLHI